jgi:crossover junction endodeoxyribonuclease RusA
VISVCVRAPGGVFLTANGRGAWQRTAGLVAKWRMEAAWAARVAEVPKQTERVRIVAEYRFKTKRRRDVGNWYPTTKACIDGLVDAGVLPDDNDTWVQGPDPRIGPADSGGGCVVLHFMPCEAERP